MTRRRFSRTPEASEKARDLRNTATREERVLWTLLSGRKLDGFRFRRQHPIGPYVLDFYCPEARLAVELDGAQHGEDEGRRKDLVRDAVLAAEGVKVLRFWNHEIGRDGVDVADAIREVLLERGEREAGRAIDPVTGRLNRPAAVARAEAVSAAAERSPPGPPFSRGGIREEFDAILPLEKHSVVPPLEKGGAGGDRPVSKGVVPPPSPNPPDAALPDVPRETLQKLERYDTLLIAWSAHTNLVARSTLPDRWRRHFSDSAQLFPLLPPDARRLVDFGSGAGFPGLVLAAMGEAQGLKVFLIESIGKKAAFLTEAAAAMGLSNVTVIPQRIESLTLPAPDVITARALASLDRLCAYAFGLAGPTARCLFLKGQDVENELTEATKSWTMTVTRYPSRTDPGATILDIRSLAPKLDRPPRKDLLHASAHSRHRQSKGGSRQDDDRNQSRNRARRRRRKSAAD